MDLQPISDRFGVIVQGTPNERISDLGRNQVIDLFKRYGVIHFRGFRSAIEDFQSFADRFGTQYAAFRGGGYVRRCVNGSYLFSTRYDYRRDKQLSFAIPLHGEMYYAANAPQLLWFYCGAPAAEGGETTVCDGAELLDSLSPGSREILTSQRLKYIRTYLDGEWQPIYQTEDIDSAVDFAMNNGLTVEIDRERKALRTEYRCFGSLEGHWNKRPIWINNLQTVYWQERMGIKRTQVRFEDDSEIPGELLEEIEAIESRLTIPIRWETGDIAMIDNTWALHGRYAFNDTRREIYLLIVRKVDW